MFRLTTKLACSNLIKNRKLYYPFAIAVILAVTIAYLFDSLTFNPHIHELRGGSPMLFTLGLGLFVVNAAGAIIVLYANSFVMKNRSKELGIYSMLGLEKRHLISMIFKELFIFGFVTISSGVLIGALFDKLIFAFLLKPVSYTHLGEALLREISDTIEKQKQKQTEEPQIGDVALYQQLYNQLMALHQQLQDKGASDAVFDRLEALFDQLANPKSDKAALLQAIQAFQAELAATPSASEVTKPATTVETPVATETPVEKEAAASEGSKPATTETETEPASAAVTEASTPDAPSPQNQ